MKKIITTHSRPRFTPHPLIAHRGLHRGDLHGKGNTLDALLNSLKSGYGIEFDVQALKDDTLVIYHNFKTANGRLLTDQTVEEFTTNMIKEHRDLLTFDMLFEYISELTNLDTIGMGIDLEIKGDIQVTEDGNTALSDKLGSKIASALHTIFTQHPHLKQNVFVTSFYDAYLIDFTSTMKDLNPEDNFSPPTGVLACKYKGRENDRMYEDKTDAEIHKHVAERIEKTGSQFCVLEASLAGGDSLKPFPTLVYGVSINHSRSDVTPFVISDFLHETRHPS
jgi:glycerophosphoryl diester phosphodiesterase